MPTTTAIPHPTLPADLDNRRSGDSRVPSAASTGEQLVLLAREVDANQYRIVHLAAAYDDGLEWFHRGLKSPAAWLSAQLDIHTSTAREWIRVGHALRYLPLIDAAFASRGISYAKARILTRFADPENEPDLLDLALERTANRLTTAIAKHLADNGETDQQRDQRLHQARSFTSWTDGDGMTIIRAALPPAIAKPILAAIEELLRRIATTPTDPDEATVDGADEDLRTAPATEATATTAAGEPTETTTRQAVEEAGGDAAGPAVRDEHDPNDATSDHTQRDRHASVDVCDRRGVDALRVAEQVTERTAAAAAALPRTLADMRRRWHPTDDDWPFPNLAQQRADAFTALFLGLAIDLTTEVVIHVRGDGTTFDDGAPVTTSAIVRQLDHAFIRLMIHDTERRPINASSRRRHPTTAQRRVVMETHNHECIDCHSTDLLELDHNPPYRETGHTITHELEPRCAPCHHARHRHDHAA